MIFLLLLCHVGIKVYFCRDFQDSWMITRKFLFVIVAVGLWSCVSCRPQTSVNNEIIVDEVTQEELADSMENNTPYEYELEESEELEEEMLPVPNRKEAFSEFFFTFLSNRSFQASRVKFPLPVSDEDNEYVIRSGKDFREYFAWPDVSEYCMLVRREEQMEEFLNNMDISDVDVQLIDLSTERIRQFHFHRAQNEWLAMSAKEYMAEGTLGEFLDFYGKFTTDSVYQQNHLSEKIELTQSDIDEEEENVKGTIEAYQWSIFRPEMPNGQITNFLFGQDLEDCDNMMLMHSSIADGMVESFKFQRQNGHWILVGYNN